MKRTRVLTAAVALALVALGAAPANAHPAHRYLGTEYHQGGAVTPIDGPLPQVDATADRITRRTDAVAREVAAHRAQLASGDITPPRQRPALWTYPAPAGVAASDRYRVSVTQRPGQPRSSFVYQALARKTDTNKEVDTSWTSFSFTGPIVVAVTALQPIAATGCLVRPASAEVRAHLVGQTCVFALTSAANVSVEFTPQAGAYVTHPMLVFANPPEVDTPPAAGDENVLYLGPGFHHLGSGVELHDDETIYLAGGAYVEGAFIAHGPVHNVTIKGRGILDGGFLDTGSQASNKGQPGMIDIADQSSSNVLVDGITLVNGPRFNVRALARYTTIHNVKVMSWWYSTDGMVGGHDSVLEDNFVKVNDDSIKLFWGDTIARHNTIWQLENGAPFMISWNIERDAADFHVYDDDVIHAEHNSIRKSGIFRALHAGAATMSRYLFENIRVADAHYRLFDLTLENNKWYDPALGYGQVRDLIFRNVTADGPFRIASQVHGIDPEHTVADVTFQDVTIGGQPIRSATDANLVVDQSNSDAIRFVTTAGGHR
ncbi:hypothetical protein Athai_17210 [Actinocatenispora thailandica]|uniref:Endo-polygalacturonase n=1 Tax=Actinocatenispora thailandica TaxID=227318 RepID=A0A7R7HVV6_9ACTN|nr:hypothetical protein [Actinocatenispora thailandica]BCJ34218.1 hypothetical protein Athai_17210 [Actinocatenispora thailandica]